MQYNFKNIRVSSAPQALAQQIIDRIKSGDLCPGDRLPSQRELAQQFGVGLSSIREALKILDVMGCVNVAHGRGTFIAENAQCHDNQLPDTARTFEAVSLRDLMKTREVVECAAAEMAAEQADDENVNNLVGLIKAMKNNHDDTKKYYQLDFEFHMAVAEATNNKAIIEIAKLLVERSHDYIGFMDDSLNISMPKNAQQAIDTADQVVGHIASGRSKAAGRAMYDHLNIVNVEIYKEFSGKKPL